MGWSWAFFLVQQLHERIADRQGFVATKRLVASWPAPVLAEHSALCLPYCDNLTIYGLDAEKVQEGIDLMTNGFEKVGFDLHEFSGVLEVSRVLGFEVSGGAEGLVRPLADKVWRLRATIEHVVQGKWASGQTWPSSSASMSR